MQWVAHTNARDHLPAGSRFYLTPDPEMKGRARKSLRDGDEIHIEANSGTRQAATVSRVEDGDLDLTLTKSGRVITLRPTPPDAGPPAFLVRDDAVEFGDWTSIT